MEWGDYWRKVCAPKLQAQKKQLGRAVPLEEIATAVEAATGKPSGRVLVNMWLLGEREPFISQFFALCQKLQVDPLEVLQKSRQHSVRQPLIHRRGGEIPGISYKNQRRRTG